MSDINDWEDYTPVDPNATAPPAPAPASGDWEDVGSNHQHYNLSGVPGAAIQNVPGSAGRFVGDIYQAVRHPIDTASNVKNLVEGYTSKGVGMIPGVQQDPAQKAKDEASANALNQMMVERYGGWDNVKRTMAEDPVGFLSDLSIPFTAGAGAARTATTAATKAASAARLAGTTAPLAEKIADASGMAARGLGAVGTATNPITLTGAAVGQATKHFGDQLASVAGGGAGISGKGMRNIFKAGLEGNPAYNAAKDGVITPLDTVEGVRNALGDFAKDYSDAYKSGMSQMVRQPLYTGFDTAGLPIYPKIDSMWNQLKAEANVGGATKASDQAVLNQIEKAIAAHRAIPPNDPAHTLLGLDKFKQIINEIPADPGSSAERLRTKMANSVKDTITDADPEYAKVMRGYQVAADNMNDIRKEVLGGNSSNTGAKLRKILSTQKSPYGGSLMDQLAEKNPNLPYVLAGHEVAQAHGFGKTGILAAAAGVAKGYPAAALAPLVTYPPLVAGTAYAAGKVAGLPATAGKYINSKLPTFAQGPVNQAAQGVAAATPLARKAAIQAARPIGELGQRQNEQKIAPGMFANTFKRGGAPGGNTRLSTAEHRRKAQALIKAAHAAKKAHNTNTEPLLNVDDNTVAKALAVANQHI